MPVPTRLSSARLRHGVYAALWAACMAAASPAHGQSPREWRDYAGGPDSSRFVATTQITKDNVHRLQAAWTYPAGQTDFNPLIVRNVVYAIATGDAFVALDASNGQELWRQPGLGSFAVRGINYWESADGADRRLLFVHNNFLQALDARTGQPIPSFGVNGKVDLREGLDRDPATISAESRTPGRVFEDLLILGSATNQEYLSAPGDIRAFNVRTGAVAWTFHTVPRPGEFGYETWPADAWKTVGGANNWGEQSIDAVRGIVYVPTASPKYNFYGGNRHGANLFSDCLLALDARTGKRLWHFQTVHHDIWDLDNNSAPQLTTIRRNGQPVDVVAVAGKTGFLYVFDRVTGAPIWPIEERPVPTRTDVAGESVWPTQPFPTSPAPFARQSFTADDINPYILTPEDRERFRQRILKARNDGLFTPIGYEDTIHMPGNSGGSNWGSTAANPSDGSVYVSSLNVPAIIRLLKPGETRTSQLGPTGALSTVERPLTDGFGLYATIVKPPYTTLTAYDLNQGTIKWQIGLGDDLRLVPQGITGTGAASTTKNGVIPTATGLVFATGADRKVHVYDSETGKQISEIQLAGATSGSPSMYDLDGRQYLLVTTNAGMTAYALPQ